MIPDLFFTEEEKIKIRQIEETYGSKRFKYISLFLLLNGVGKN